MLIYQRVYLGFSIASCHFTNIFHYCSDWISLDVRCQSHGVAERLLPAAGDAAAVGDLVRERQGEWMKKCGKTVENLGKTWQNHEKMWENLGKPWKHVEKHMKHWGLTWIKWFSYGNVWRKNHLDGTTLYGKLGKTCDLT